jgi:hypothetical protein
LREKCRLRVFVNGVLRRIFGPERDEVAGEWRKLLNEELSALYCLPKVIRVVKSRRMRWANNVARMEREEVYTGFWCEYLRKRHHLEKPVIDGRILLKYIFKK